MRARQIPEWEEYDNEIAKFARKLAEEGKISSRVAAADSNALAQTAGAVSPNDDVVEVVDTEQNGVDGGETETEKKAEKKKEIRDEL